MHVAACRATGSSSEVGTREAEMCLQLIAQYKTACIIIVQVGINSAAQCRMWRTVGGRNASIASKGWFII